MAIFYNSHLTSYRIFVRFVYYAVIFSGFDTSERYKIMPYLIFMRRLLSNTHVEVCQTENFDQTDEL